MTETAQVKLPRLGASRSELADAFVALLNARNYVIEHAPKDHASSDAIGIVADARRAVHAEGEEAYGGDWFAVGIAHAVQFRESKRRRELERQEDENAAA